MMTVRVIAAMAMALLPAACGADFDPASRIVGPRVVAVVAEPPELPFDGVARLTAVVTEPQLATDVEFSVCPLSTGSTGGYACAAPEIPLESEGLSATLDAAPFEALLAGLGAAFEAGAEGLRRTLVSGDPCLEEVLARYEACDAGAGCAEEAGEAAAACLREGGTDAVVRVRLRLAGGEPFDTFKRVRLREGTADHPANRNPRLAGVRVVPVDRTAEAVTLGADGEADVGAGEAVQLVPLLEEGSVEAWLEDGDEQRELVSYSWFATAGSFDYGRSTADVPEVELAVPALDDEDARDRLQLWLVARDDRYGTDALAFSLRVRDAGGAP